jgi:hypothetical protein
VNIEAKEKKWAKSMHPATQKPKNCARLHLRPRPFCPALELLRSGHPRARSEVLGLKLQVNNPHENLHARFSHTNIF